ncbi:hypothetical protein AZE42_11039 [Rhizopogon vesiculosus]|uniref:Uncharacterized protein n=1 Tax=Rhizopogon vesiculosus TaxID=180088 RepID=A0A1J8QKT3_9AGAM|nr:hypothetical protein AZE42_11039 [Rhizopogon vesiculosus]
MFALDVKTDRRASAFEASSHLHAVDASPHRTQDKPSFRRRVPRLNSPLDLLQLPVGIPGEGSNGAATNSGTAPAMLRCTRVKIFTGHEDDVYALATFPDGERIATGSVDGTIRIWRLEDGREMKKWDVGKMVGTLAILRNGIYVVSAEGDSPRGDFDKTVYWQLWVRDAETGRVVAGPLNGHTNAVFTLDISPDHGILASGSIDRTVILWDTKTW